MLPQTFDLTLACKLAQFALQAYAKPGSYSVIEDFAIVSAPHSGCSVLLADIGDYLVLAFQGTENVREALTDARIQKWHRGDVAIHSGFLDAWDELCPKILLQLMAGGRRRSDMKPMLICGHSLGGALATEAAYYLQKLGYPIAAVYTFASPRVGNAAFRDRYNAVLDFKTFRVCAAGDLVPLLPGLFTPPFDGYRHVGIEVFLNGSALVNPSHRMELACDGWRAWRAIRRADWDFILQFHSITENYLVQLNRLDRKSHD
jgi:hypothetical protein